MSSSVFDNKSHNLDPVLWYVRALKISILCISHVVHLNLLKFLKVEIVFYPLGFTLSRRIWHDQVVEDPDPSSKGCFLFRETLH